MKRRDFLKLAGVAVATVMSPGWAAAGLWDRLIGPAARATPPITPNEDFYVTSYRTPPSVRQADWSLTVKGLVERPLILTYDKLLERPSVSEIVTLECIGNGVAGDAIGTAEWTGVSLKHLLEDVGLSSGAYDVVFRAADDYSDSIPVSRAMAGDVLLAYRMNGVPLPAAHGFPLRVIVPGVYGMKSVQWLTGIELVQEDYRGYYQRKGWSDDATIKTMSRIDLPGHGAVLDRREILVQGLAFAGTRGIRQVEVSTEADRWIPAELGPPISPAAWVFWQYRWRPPAAGYYTLSVRAADGTGRLQGETDQAPYPDGAAALHQITVRVR